MNPFVRLGLSADADEAQIKRAYARLLRTTRPDDDPAGFQLLNDAYQRCLAWARQRALATVEAGVDALDHDHAGENDAQDDDAWAAADAFEFTPIAFEPKVQAPESAHEPRIVAPPDPSPRPIPIPPPPDPFARPSAAAGASAHTAKRPIPRSPHPHAAATAPVHDAEHEPAYDNQRLLAELSDIAHTRPAEELERWLRENPALYSVARKQTLAPALVTHLGEQPTLYLKQLDVVLHFFDLDTVHERTSPLQARIADLRARARARGLDFRELEFDPNPRPGKRAAGFRMTPQMVFYLLIGLVLVGRMLKAVSESGHS